MTVPAGSAPGVCTLCGAPLAGVGRCSACGLSQEGVPGRPPFTASALLMLAVVLAAVYAVTLVVVILAR